MCSTPRPKRKVKSSTAGFSGSVLASMSSVARGDFANRANAAQDRRDEIALINKAIQPSNQIKLVKAKLHQQAISSNNQHWRYWLLTASFKEIMTVFFIGKSKVKH